MAIFLSDVLAMMEEMRSSDIKQILDKAIRWLPLREDEEKPVNKPEHIGLAIYEEYRQAKMRNRQSERQGLTFKVDFQVSFQHSDAEALAKEDSYLMQVVDATAAALKCKVGMVTSGSKKGWENDVRVVFQVDEGFLSEPEMAAALETIARKLPKAA